MIAAEPRILGPFLHPFDLPLRLCGHGPRGFRRAFPAPFHVALCVPLALLPSGLPPFAPRPRGLAPFFAFSFLLLPSSYLPNLGGHADVKKEAGRCLADERPAGVSLYAPCRDAAARSMGVPPMSRRAIPRLRGGRLWPCHHGQDARAT